MKRNLYLANKEAKNLIHNITATVIPGSYAERYCQGYGIAVQYA